MLVTQWDKVGMTDKTLFTSQTMPMSTGEWRLRLAQLCRDCAVAEGGEEADYLRLALRLMAMAPEADRMIVADHLPPEARFEALIAMGAYDSAAMTLLPEQASYLLSRSGAGACLASVLLPQVDEEMTSEAQSPALAVVSALLACVVTMAGAQAGVAVVIEDEVEWQRPAGARLH